MIQFYESGRASGVDRDLWTLKSFIDIVQTCDSRVTGKMFGPEAQIKCLDLR